MKTSVKPPVETIPLADPAQRPEADLVIFDGQCRFCRAQVERLARWDRGQKLAFISLHDPRVPERFPDLTHEQLMQDMYLIDRRGHRHRGAAALKYLSRQLRPLWPLAPILHLPFVLPVAQAVYRQIAKRRYLMGKIDDCDDGSCRVHFDK
jgi:predicted DCC family thiol-disulfide oxidoreductase YuxK